MKLERVINPMLKPGCRTRINPPYSSKAEGIGCVRLKAL
jgi:hypothetical protein